MAIDSSLNAKREIMKIVRRDIHQILCVGKSVSDGTQPNLKESFIAMYCSLADLKSKYMAIFEECLCLAVQENKTSLFPNEEDLKLRNDVNSFCYKIVEYHTALSSQSINNSSHALNASLNETTNSRLPKIPLPKFSGRIEEWPKFKQIFESMVHNNPSLAAIDKYHYLSTHITGDASSLIASFTISSENYHKAWEALTMRYQNKRLLANTYMDKILEFAPFKGPPTLSSLQSFVANIAESIAALKSLDIEDEADFVWLTISLRKLDPTTRRQFEIDCINSEWPTFQSLIKFIHGRSQVMQLSNPSSYSSPSAPTRPSSRSHPILALTSSSSKTTCDCTSSHPLFQCPRFRSKSPSSRRSFLKGKILCFNCLRSGHVVGECPSSSRCRKCQGKHHTLLHHDSRRHEPNQSTAQPSISSTGPDPTPQPPLVASVTGPTPILLGTAEILVSDHQNTFQPVRALVDPASHFSLLTSDCARRLGLAWVPTRKHASCAGDVSLPNVKGQLSISLRPRSSSELFHIELLVVKTITGPLPSTPLQPPHEGELSFGLLADPKFWETGPIELLLGGQLFLPTITGTPVNFGEYQALPTIFGLVVIGASKLQPSLYYPLRCHCVVESPLDNEAIVRFWETEDVATPLEASHMDPCEQHFLDTHYRTSSGRYVVALPFKQQPVGMESSKHLAMRQYKSLESRLLRNPTLNEKYSAFLQEYLDLEHMSLTSSSSSYVIPHHGVFKAQDPEAKIRVVFNASARSPDFSLNDFLLAGPKLQQDLTTVILNFRLHLIALTADLVKMYRQVLVRPEDRRFQHILWRPDPSQDIQVFELNTVTYGIVSSAFHALRVLVQLVRDEGKPYPLASMALLDERYVDDIVSGADSIEEARILMTQLKDLLAKGRFKIHKWTSNSREIVPESASSLPQEPISLSPKDSETKILGMLWDPLEDFFFYHVKPIDQGVTKRSILSVIAHLFDPMGFLAPVVFKAKTILQRMWQSGIDWDSSPPPNIAQDWQEFSSELPFLDEIRIPRYVWKDKHHHRQVIGFCDASERGFAAVIYLRVLSSSEDPKVSLLKAKTKLAPLKTLTVPRLELSGAHLLVKLMLSILPSFKSLDISDTFFFTDSTIVLSWLQISPNLLQTFVGNRVSFIVSNSDVSQWFHVSSAENPADLASRGASPSLLRLNSLWWAGPQWLHNPNWMPTRSAKLQNAFEYEVKEEMKSGYALVVEDSAPELIKLISRFSRYRTLLHVFSYVRRFILNCRPLHSEHSPSGQLTLGEIENSLQLLIHAVQLYEFAKEFSWSENRPLSKRLKVLAAYADNDGLIRVGGRLQNSELPDEVKFPIILPGRCHFMSLLIRHLHHVHFHLGFQALQAHIRRRYWVFRLRQVLKAELRKCLTCFKASARPQAPIMGYLPSCRVRPSRPFTECGVDFAGPFSIKLSARRNPTTTKAYLCIFLCMATRAVHLEVVSSLSTDSFLATLDRFVARRGCPQHIYSDCGTNFVGAENRLRELYSWFRAQPNRNFLHEHTVSQGIQWHFNPPLSPHFGGIWEAAVKSAKRHLHRVTQQRTFSFEELTTLFTRIEAILNSRPLCPMQNDTSQGDVLTPGHFLIGAPLISSPEKDHVDIPLNRLSRWQLITHSIQHFWRRWHAEYLHSLTRRPKWYQTTRPLKIGDLVLLPDSNSTPLQWRLSRIVGVHPGNDGVIRVVTLQDKLRTFKRSVTAIVSLSHLREPDAAPE